MANVKDAELIRRALLLFPGSLSQRPWAR